MKFYPMHCQPPRLHQGKTRNMKLNIKLRKQLNTTKSQSKIINDQAFEL